MVDEVAELRAHLEREQSLRIELEDQLKDYAARLGETFVEPKPKENTQTTIQYHHNTNTVIELIVLSFFSLNFEYIVKLFLILISVCGR